MLWADKEDEPDVRLVLDIVAVVTTTLAVAVVIVVVLRFGPQMGKILNRITSGLIGAVLLPLLQGPIYHPSMDAKLVELWEYFAPVCIPIIMVTLIGAPIWWWLKRRG